jgi:xylulokinase
MLLSERVLGMDAGNLVGIDIGTQGVKGAVFSKDGCCLAEAYVESKLYRPSAGIVEEDPEFQVASVCRVIKRCVKNAGIRSDSVAAIGIDGQTAGIIGIGKDGRNATPYDSWLDTRCAPYIGIMQKRAGERVLAKTGNEKTFKAIKSFVQPAGYAAMRLCGLGCKQAFIDTTYLHFSGFADNKNSRWDTILCKTFKLEMDKLPTIVDPKHIVGHVSRTAAGRCGVKAGTPVVAGCGDTSASFLACGAVRKGVCVDVAGTASVFASTTDQFTPDTKHKILSCSQAATNGLWHNYAYINGGGMNLEWFRKEIAGGGRKAVQKALDFDYLNRMAEKVLPEENAPMFAPHLGGRVSPPVPCLKGAWVNLSWAHTIGHLYHAILESVALEYGIYKSVITDLCPQLKLNEIRVTGGGEKSKLWNGIKADVLQIPVVRTTRQEGAVMGSAMVAGVGAGIFESLQEVAKRWVGRGAVFDPQRDLRDYYVRRVNAYRSLLSHLSDFCAE